MFRFSIFLVEMAIYIPLWLYSTVTNLATSLHFFMNSAACFRFPISKTFYLIKILGALKAALRDKFYCCKCRNFGLTLIYNFGFYHFILGYYPKATWKIESRWFTNFSNIFDSNTNPDPYRVSIIGHTLWSCINVDYFQKLGSYLTTLDSIYFIPFTKSPTVLESTCIQM